jgi:hypothetical protein
MLLENYIEMQHGVELWRRKRSGDHAAARTSPFRVSLLVHHMLVLLVELQTFRTRSIVYCCNTIKLYELTAPFSFLVYLVQRRTKWHEESRQSTRGVDKGKDLPIKDDIETMVDDAPVLCGDTLGKRVAWLRIAVWLGCRTAFDVWVRFELKSK